MPRNYQDDLVTPGMSPRSANWRKHSRHTPNLRMYARGRPHRWQRLCWRDENFGLRASFTLFAVVDMLPLDLNCRALPPNFLLGVSALPALNYAAVLNGMPNCRSRA